MATRGKKPLSVRIAKLPDGAHKRAGAYDKARRWYPFSEYQIPGAFRVRAPSARWPFSYLSHFYTGAYARRLVAARPLLYLDLMGIPPECEEGARILAAYAADRIGVAGVWARAA